MTEYRYGYRMNLVANVEYTLQHWKGFGIFDDGLEFKLVTPNRTTTILDWVTITEIAPAYPGITYTIPRQSILVELLLRLRGNSIPNRLSDSGFAKWEVDFKNQYSYKINWEDLNITDQATVPDWDDSFTIISASKFPYLLSLDYPTNIFTPLTQNFAPAPANDNFADAQLLTGTSGTIEVTNAGASYEPGEPYYLFGGASIWFKYVPAFDGTLTISTSAASSGEDNYDTTLQVWTGSSLTSLSLIDYNDDTDYDYYSEVVFSASAGTTYYITADSYSYYQTGRFNLSWNLV